MQEPKNWTPPSDAVPVTDKWTPPADAQEVKKKDQPVGVEEPAGQNSGVSSPTPAPVAVKKSSDKGVDYNNTPYRIDNTVKDKPLSFTDVFKMAGDYVAEGYKELKKSQDKAVNEGVKVPTENLVNTNPHDFYLKAAVTSGRNKSHMDSGGEIEADTDYMSPIDLADFDNYKKTKENSSGYNPLNAIGMYTDKQMADMALLASNPNAKRYEKILRQDTPKHLDFAHNAFNYNKAVLGKKWEALINDDASNEIVRTLIKLDDKEKSLSKELESADKREELMAIQEQRNQIAEQNGDVVKEYSSIMKADANNRAHLRKVYDLSPKAHQDLIQRAETSKKVDDYLGSLDYGGRGAMKIAQAIPNLVFKLAGATAAIPAVGLNFVQGNLGMEDYGLADRWLEGASGISTYLEKNQFAHDVYSPLEGEGYKAKHGIDAPILKFDDDGSFNSGKTLKDAFSDNSNLPWLAANTLGDMAILIGGGRAASKGLQMMGAATKGANSAGLMMSSYAMTAPMYYEAAKKAGVPRPKLFSQYAATFTSLLELISPNEAIAKTFTNEGVDAFTKTALKSIATGKTVKQGALDAAYGFAKGLVNENTQEFSQLVADKAMEASANYLGGEQYFEHNYEQMKGEALETVLLTTIATGLASTPATLQSAKQVLPYDKAVELVARDKKKYMPLIQDMIKTQKINPESVARIMKDIDERVSINQQYGEEIAYIDKSTKNPITKDQALEAIIDGNPFSVEIFNDPDLQTLQRAKTNELTQQAVVTSATADSADINTLIKRGGQMQLDSYGDQQINETGNLYQEGQQVVFETATRKYELGSIEEVGGKIGSDLGLSDVSNRISVSKDGSIRIKTITKTKDGVSTKSEKLIDPTPNSLDAIKRNDKGEVERVVLRSEDGKTTRTFRGQEAMDLAYQLKLKFNEQEGQSKKVDQVIAAEEDLKSKKEKVREYIADPKKFDKDRKDKLLKEVKGYGVGTVVTEEQSKLMIADKRSDVSQTGRVMSNLFKVMDAIWGKNVPTFVMLANEEVAGEIAHQLDPENVKKGELVNGFINRELNIVFFVPNANTAIHEAMMHPLIDAIQYLKPELYNEFLQDIEGIMTGDVIENENGEKVPESYVDRAKSDGYKPSKVKMEAIVNFLSTVGASGYESGYFNSIATKLADAFRKLLKFLHITEKDLLINLDNKSTLQNFAKVLAGAIKNSQKITLVTDKPAVKEEEKKPKVEKKGTDYKVAKKKKKKTQAELVEASKKAIENSSKFNEAVPLEPVMSKGKIATANGNVKYKQVPYNLENGAKEFIDKNSSKAADIIADELVKDYNENINRPEIKAAIGWYSNMRDWFQKNFGANIEMFGQLLAATSARTNVYDNFAQSIEAMRNLSKGKYDDLIQRYDNFVKSIESMTDAQLLDMYKQKYPKRTDASFNKNKEDFKVLLINEFPEFPFKSNGKKFNANSKKVLQAMYGNWLIQTQGPKTKNFAGNLTGRSYAATIDIWAARYLRRKIYQGNAKQWRILPMSEGAVQASKLASGKISGDYAFAEGVMQKAADKLGINADDLQAFLWYLEKDVWDKNNWTNKSGKAKASFEDGASTLNTDRYQGGVTTFVSEDTFSKEEFLAARKEISKTIQDLNGVIVFRATESQGEYMGTSEPTFDIEFTVDKGTDVTSVLNKITEIGRRFKQEAIIFSKVVDEADPDARPMLEIGLKESVPSSKAIENSIAVASQNGINGLTISRDRKGNMLGVRMQFIPEFSGDQDRLAASKKWIDAALKVKESLANEQELSYIEQGYVSTKVIYTKDEAGRTEGNDQVLKEQGLGEKSTEGQEQGNVQSGNQSKPDQGGRGEANQYVQRLKDQGLDDLASALPKNFKDQDLSFVGIKASKRLGSKSLVEARAMEQAKVSAKEIWKKTGWERGADGHWMSEIFDPKTARINQKTLTDKITQAKSGYAQYTLPLSEVLKHPKLFKAYPELSKISVKLMRLKDGHFGTYHTGKNKIDFDPTKKVSNETATGYLLHEVQHAIQEIESQSEGAAGGTSAYWSNIGEVVARNVENRLGLTEIERQNTPPSETEDINRKEQTSSAAMVNKIMTGFNNLIEAGNLTAIDALTILKAANYKVSHPYYAPLIKQAKNEARSLALRANDDITDYSRSNKPIPHPVYSGLFVNNTAELKQKYPPVHPNEYYHHSTIEFKPTNLDNFPLGDATDIKVVGRFTNNKVDALIVENPMSKNKYPHITLSTANGVKPFESNTEITKNPNAITPLNDVIKGTYGVFNGKDITSTDYSKKKSPTATTKRVIEPDKTVAPPLRKDYLANPESDKYSREPQSIKKQVEAWSTMSTEEVQKDLSNKGVQELLGTLIQLDGSNNFAQLGLIELFNRATKSNDFDLAMSAYAMLNKIGTGVGQLLRQMRELKSAIYSPNAPRAQRISANRGLVRTIVFRYFDKMGVVLTANMKSEAENLINNYVVGHANEVDLENIYNGNKTKINSDRLADAKNQTTLAMARIEDFMAENVPIGLSQLASNLIKGNLLTISSVIVNVTSNTANALQTGVIEGQAVPLLRGGARLVGMNVKGSDSRGSALGALYATAVFGKTFFPAFKEAFTQGGMRPSDMGKFEVMRHIHPSRALKQLFTGNLPKKYKVQGMTVTEYTPYSVYLEKMMEGTLGWPAAFFFRVLHATDKPYKAAARMFAATQQLSAKNGGGFVSPLQVQQYLTEATPEIMEKLDRYADKFAYSDTKSGAALLGNKISGVINKWADDQEADEAHLGLHKLAGGSLRMFATALNPYVTVPSNILQHLVEIIVPPVALYGASKHYKAGNREIGDQMVGRLAISIIFYSLGAAIYSAGLIVAGDDEDDIADRSLKNSVGGSFSINMSGLERKMFGGDPTLRKGDKSVTLQKLGIFGMFMGFQARWAQQMKKDNKWHGNFMESIKDDTLGAFGVASSAALKTSIEQSFFKAQFDLVESIRNSSSGKNAFNRFTTSMVETTSNLVWANQYSQFAQGVYNKEMLKPEDPTWSGLMAEKFTKRMPFLPSDSELYPVLNMWGTPVSNSFLKTNDPFKIKESMDATSIEIWNLMTATGKDNPVTFPTKSITIDDVSYPLDEGDYLTLQALTGNLRQAEISEAIADIDYITGTPEEKYQIIQWANERANSRGKIMFENAWREDLEYGQIELDTKGETYKHTGGQYSKERVNNLKENE